MHLDIFGEKWELKKRNLEAQGFAGLCDPESKTIIIDEKQKGKTLKHTLIHEMFHAMWYRTGIAQAGLPHEVHEILAENIATVIIENFNLSFKNEKHGNKNKLQSQRSSADTQNSTESKKP